MKSRAFLTICLFLTGSLLYAKPNSLDRSRVIKDSIEIKIDTMIAQMGLSAKTPGGVVGIIKNGKLIFKKAYGLANLETGEPIKTSTLFNLASVSKQFTAAAILILAKENKLSLKDDIRKYLPDFPDYGYTITIENLIHHTCGVKSYDVLKLMAGTSNSKEDQEEIYHLIANQKSLNFIPGNEFLYSNSGYILLAKIIEKTSGMKFSNFIEEKIFQPLGMNHTDIYDKPGQVVKNSAAGHTRQGADKFNKTAEITSTVVGQSNIYTSVEDFLRWDNNFYKNKLGKWDFSKEMTSLSTLKNGDICKYAFGLEVSEHNGLKTITHQGGTLDFTAQFIQIPSEKFSVIVLFNAPVDATGLAYQIADLYFKGKPKTIHVLSPPVKTMVDSTVLQAYAGKYFDEDHWNEVTISRDGDHLAMDGPYQDRIELNPSSDSSFFTKFADLGFIFNKGINGKNTSLTVIQGNQKFKLTYLGPDEVPVKTEKLSRYAGNYYCEEINVTYPVLFKDNKLFVKFPVLTARATNIPVESELLSEHEDYFASPISIFKFSRDTENEISGFIIKDVGRVRNLVFKKVK